MTIVEIILLAGGVGVFIASYFVGNKKEEKDKEEVVVHNTELSEEDKAKIQEQVDGIISEKMEDVSERTEAKMDKISNTKMLELNDYAETIMNEINRNHNETVFLYDMLNEKAKEVKNTVKDVNIAKKEVNRIAAQQVNDNAPKPAENNNDDNTVKQQEEVKAPAVKNNAGLNNQIDSSLYNNINKTTDGGNDYGYKAPEASKDLAKERLMEIVKSASKTSQPKEDNTKADESKKAEADKAESDTKKADEAKADSSAKEAESDKADSSAENADSETESSTAKSSSKTTGKATSKASATTAKSASTSKTVAKTSAKTTTAKAATKTASKPRKSTAKKPANQAGELVKMASAPKAEDIVAGFDENMTNNERIVELSRQGIGNKEIAKVLNIALGEVKLIVDLHNSNSSD